MRWCSTRRRHSTRARSLLTTDYSATHYILLHTLQEILNPSSLPGRSILRHCSCSAPLLCPALLLDIHPRSESAGKCVDLIAGGYRFDDAWGTAALPARVRSWGSHYATA